MESHRPYVSAGQRLRAARRGVGLSTREVQAKSAQIAADKKNQEFYLSHAWLTDLEKGKFRLGLFKLYSLSVIYSKSVSEIASYFGLRMSDLNRDRILIGVPKTHLVQRPEEAEAQNVSLPVEFKPEFRFENTNLLARVVQKWSGFPVGFLQYLDLKKSVYGYIGLEDTTLYPLIRPGSLVEIDPSQRKISTAKWRTEFDRPIYFIELHDGYLCSWCELDRGQLMVIPHPQSRLAVRHFEYPSEAEIVGRVTGVAMRIVLESELEGAPTAL